MRRRLGTRLLKVAVGGALACAAWSAGAQESFRIERFEITGATLLKASDAQALVAPSVGQNRSVTDISKAIAALQTAYRQQGFGAVTVTAPEQELTSGTVRLEVHETRLSKVTVKGNLHFDEANIRASLPALQQGRTPNLRQMSDSIQLANDNPAKQVAVSLAANESDGSVDAAVDVTDYNPLRVIGSLDNTGTSSSGHWRTGVALQHANLFGRDQVGTLAYTTSPDSPSGVHVNLYSAGYRIPVYGLGDSLDLLYGRSSVNVPGSSPTLGGVLGFTGKGQVFGLHWNHFLPRDGETTSKIIAGLDRRETDSSCDVDGIAVDTDAPTPPIAACVPYTTQPLSLTYSSQRQGASMASDYFIGVSRNFATGPRHTNIDGRVDRYSYLTPGNRATSDTFVVLRAGGSYLQGLAGGWQARIVGNAQYTNDALLLSERLGLTGAQAVRGFEERSVTADSGAFVNAELTTPNLAEKLYLPGDLRALAFVDAGRGFNNRTAATAVPGKVSVASFGAGLRAGFGRDVSVRLDVARVAKAGDSTTESQGDWKAHVAASFAY